MHSWKPVLSHSEACVLATKRYHAKLSDKLGRKFQINYFQGTVFILSQQEVLMH